MRRSMVLSVAIALGAAAFLRPDESGACGGYWPAIVFVRSTGPDVPTGRSLEGVVGLVDPWYDVDDLAIVYRHLVGLGLDADERASVVTARERERTLYEGDDRARPWLASRARVTGEDDRWLNFGYNSDDYEFVFNCNADAFVRAAATLDARIASSGADSGEVRRFVDAQDQVFAACSRRESNPIADPPADASRRERNDRAYQRAARAFYLGDYPDAQTRFESIAADTTSEWRSVARYLVARVHQRRSYEEGRREPELRAAVAVLDGILADPAMATWHESARGYRDFVRTRLDPAGRFRELSVAIAAAHHGNALGTMLVDLDQLETETSFTGVPGADRFGVFVETIRTPGPESARRAAALERETGSPAFLVAALLAMPTIDALPRAEVDRLLTRAAAIPTSSPAYATAIVHRARLLLGREGVDRRAMHRALVSARDALDGSRGPSVDHALTLLAFAYATTIDEAIATSGAEDTVVDDSEYGVDELEPNVDVAELPFDFHAYGKRFLDRLPLSEWARIAQQASLPPRARAEIATVGYARALILDDAAARLALAPLVATHFPEQADAIRAVERASNDADRRYARIWLLLHTPTIRFELDQMSSLADSGFYSGATYYCPEAMPTDYEGRLALSIAGELDANETRLLRRTTNGSRAALARLAPPGVVLARAAIAAVADRPNDPRNPELLARAVRATRWACPGAGTRAASRDAFRLLHERYPRSPEAGEVRYFYGER